MFERNGKSGGFPAEIGSYSTGFLFLENEQLVPKNKIGIPWWSSGEDSALTVPSWLALCTDACKLVSIKPVLLHNKAVSNPWWVSQVALVIKNPPSNAGDVRDTGSLPGLGRSPGGGHGNPVQHSCLENPMDKGAWRAIVHMVAKSWTWLKWLIMYTAFKSHLAAC